MRIKFNHFHRKHWLIGIFVGVIIFQVNRFWGNIIPHFQSDYIITKGLVCTCPDATVIKGKDFLVSNTPDSLSNFNLDYSEIWLTERPTTFSDYQGSGQYIVYGEVVGKKQVSEFDPWNPLFKVQSFKKVDSYSDNFFRSIILFQIIILMLLIRRNRSAVKPI